jgi:hypothetical protein
MQKFENINLILLSSEMKKKFKGQISKNDLKSFLIPFISSNLDLKFDKSKSIKGHFNYKDYCDFVNLLLENGVIRKIRKETATFLGKLSVEDIYEVINREQN